VSNNRQWAIVGVIVALIVVLIGAGWLVRDRFLPVDVGDPAPDFVAADLSGNPVSLAGLKGQVVLLNIWATWCEPCRDEMPSMQRLHETMGDRGVKVVAVSIDAPIGLFDRSGQQGGNVAAFANELGLTFPIWLDPEGKSYRLYRMTAVPECFVINRAGFIVKKEIGAKEWDSPAVEELFTRLLAE
jgi:peroxiredoxin